MVSATKTGEKKLDIHELTPERLNDWLAFFDGDGFADNPGWRTCYCRCFLYDFKDGFEQWDKACANGENREVMSQRIRNGETTGLLAYRDGKVVGWCHAGPRTVFTKSTIKHVPAAKDERIFSTVCFVVSPSERRQGVARELLRGACDMAKGRGFNIVEGYPDKIAKDKPEDCDHMTGPLALYQSQDFEIYRELENCTVMRKRLD